MVDGEIERLGQAQTVAQGDGRIVGLAAGAQAHQPRLRRHADNTLAVAADRGDDPGDAGAVDFRRRHGTRREVLAEADLAHQIRMIDLYGGIDDRHADIATGGDEVKRIELPFAGVGLHAVKRIAAASRDRFRLGRRDRSLGAVLPHRFGPFDARIVRQGGSRFFRCPVGRHRHDVAVQPDHRHRPVVDQLQSVGLGAFQREPTPRAGARAAVITAAIAGVRRKMGRRQAQQDQDFVIFVRLGNALHRRVGPRATGRQPAQQKQEAQDQLGKVPYPLHGFSPASIGSARTMVPWWRRRSTVAERAAASTCSR